MSETVTLVLVAILTHDFGFAREGLPCARKVHKDQKSVVSVSSLCTLKWYFVSRRGAEKVKKTISKKALLLPPKMGSKNGSF